MVSPFSTYFSNATTNAHLQLSYSSSSLPPHWSQTLWLHIWIEALYLLCVSFSALRASLFYAPVFYFVQQI